MISLNDLGVSRVNSRGKKFANFLNKPCTVEVNKRHLYIYTHTSSMPPNLHGAGAYIPLTASCVKKTNKTCVMDKRKKKDTLF